MKASADPRVSPRRLIQGKWADCFPLVLGDLYLSSESLAKGKDVAMVEVALGDSYL